MRFETFRGTDLRRVFEMAREALGDDVMVVRSSVSTEGATRRVEVIAARAEDIAHLDRQLSPAPPGLPQRSGGRGWSGPFVVALVGPTGAGKTTTAAKLALHPSAFGQRRVGFLTLDTFRVGALEQMQTFAEIASIPFEVVYDTREVVGALKRLDDCEVVIVDTPGRSPRANDGETRWQSLLQPLSPDEVHLVVPASMRPDIAAGLRATYARCAPTHLLISKVDEAPEDGTLADLASRVDLPTRWITDGQMIPDDIRQARPRILAALGMPVAEGAAGEQTSAAA
jgi:flagellar biosynthesis protein FlhF